MHEMGHSFGMDHYGVNGSGGTSIMGYNGNGPQFDDLRCLHRAHGDKNEQNGGNDTLATANDLGTLVEGTPLEIGGDMPAADAYATILEAYTDIVSIDDDTDTDYYSFTLTDSVLVDVQVSPRGPMTYSYYYNYSTSSNSSGTAYPRESSDLSFVIYDENGSALTTVDAEEIGGTESARISLSAGTYYIAVTGDDSDANDAEEFTYTRTNWAGSGWTQFYGVSVSSFVEYAPVASDINTSTEQNTAIAVTLFGSDANGDDLTYQVVTAPSGGVLSGTAPNLTYTPNADYVGADSFTYVVNDGTADSEVATVNLMVLAPGALIPPVAHWPLDELSGETVVEDRTYNGYEGAATATTEVITGQIGNARSFNGTTSAIELPAGAFSTISDAISISLWVYGADNQPRSETVFSAMGSSGQRVAQMHLPWSNSNVYWDAGGSPGYDRINQLASAESYEGGWNHWVFTKDRLTGDMKIFLNGAVWHTGTGKTSSFVEVTSAFIGGVATESSSNYTGAIDDVILYDYALSESDVSRLYGNSPPTLSSDILTVNESGLSITLDSLDTDGDALIYILAAAPTSGSLSGVAPNLVYTPDETFSGSDSFSYYLNDGVVNSALATITIRETAVGYQAFLQQHTSIVETSFMADPDGDGVVNGLEYVLGGNPLNSDSRWGDLTGDGVNLTFSFDRLEESTSDTIQVFQYSYDLNIWNDVNLTGTIGSEASIGSAVDGMEPVTISLPGNVQTDQHLFWRLSVTEQ